MSEHTTGPWQVVAEAQSQWIVGDSDGGSIADCEPPGPWMTTTEADANVRLIAAAPELLAALKGVVAVADRATVEFDAARAAIKKATGGA